MIIFFRARATLRELYGIEILTETDDPKFIPLRGKLKATCLPEQNILNVVIED